MNHLKHILLSWIFVPFYGIAFAQGPANIDHNRDSEKATTLRVMFYNVENLFDTFDDPAIADHEFSPTGEKNGQNIATQKS